MKNIVFFALLFAGINSFAQTDTIILNRKEAIRLDSIGLQLHKLEKYKEALGYFNKALELEPFNGKIIYHRALTKANSHNYNTNYDDICDEFQKAYNYGAIIQEETLFFYGCKLRKREK